MYDDINDGALVQLLDDDDDEIRGSHSLAKLGRLSGESGQWEDNLIIVIIITIVIIIIVFITWQGHRQHSSPLASVHSGYDH